MCEDWNEGENGFNEKYVEEMEGVVKGGLESEVKDLMEELEDEMKADIWGLYEKGSIG
ncbi:hypothetical protein [Bacillus pumilus]|uniref:hypothetical protein n=1 Tax=Bacillus pumilus TaxID=1408 RepID=UPI0016427154|nr:hypothetical protein [Bacillus pumilus]